MGIVQCHGRRGVLGILEFPYPLLETFDVFPQQLSPRLALPIIILTTIRFLCANTLLAGRFDAIASLQGCERKLTSDMERTNHFSFSGQCVFKRDSSWVSVVAREKVPAAKTGPPSL